MGLIADVCSFFLPIEVQITVTVDTKNRSIQVLILHLYSLLLTILYVEQTIKGRGLEPIPEKNRLYPGKIFSLSQPLTLKISLESPNSLSPCMYLGCERKQKYPEKTCKFKTQTQKDPRLD